MITKNIKRLFPSTQAAKQDRKKEEREQEMTGVDQGYQEQNEFSV
jgi:hypothetical protein